MASSRFRKYCERRKEESSHTPEEGEWERGRRERETNGKEVLDDQDPLAVLAAVVLLEVREQLPGEVSSRRERTCTDKAREDKVSPDSSASPFANSPISGPFPYIPPTAQSFSVFPIPVTIFDAAFFFFISFFSSPLSCLRLKIPFLFLLPSAFSSSTCFSFLTSGEGTPGA